MNIYMIHLHGHVLPTLNYHTVRNILFGSSCGRLSQWLNYKQLIQLYVMYHQYHKSKEINFVKAASMVEQSNTLSH